MGWSDASKRSDGGRVMARGQHDIGGLSGARPIDPTEHPLSDWEILADAVNQAKADYVVAAGEQKSGAKREQEIARAPGLACALPRQSDDAGHDAQRAENIGDRRPFLRKKKGTFSISPRKRTVREPA